MSILKTTYNYYISKMQKSKERNKIDKEIIKMVSKLIHTKSLSESNQKRLDELISKSEG